MLSRYSKTFNINWGNCFLQIMPGCLFFNIPLKITLDQSDVSDHHNVIADLNSNFKASCKEKKCFFEKLESIRERKSAQMAQNFLREKLKNLFSPKKTIDKQISELHSSLTMHLDKFCPMKKVKPSNRKNWIDNEIKKRGYWKNK